MTNAAMKLRSWVRSQLSESSRRRIRPIVGAIRSTSIRAERAILSPRLPRNPDGKVYVNLGGGDVTHPAFINVDGMVARHIHYIRPIEDLSPIPDGFADLVYASHCLEHISHQRVNLVLAEWKRVLKPGGVLRLGVPDFDQLIAIYQATGKDMESIQLLLMGAQTYPLNAHYTMFTRKSLTKRLVDVGFTHVRPWTRGSDEFASFPDCTGLLATIDSSSPRLHFSSDGGEEPTMLHPGTYSLSINLEAVK